MKIFTNIILFLALGIITVGVYTIGNQFAPLIKFWVHFLGGSFALGVGLVIMEFIE